MDGVERVKPDQLDDLDEGWIYDEATTKHPDCLGPLIMAIGDAEHVSLFVFLGVCVVR